MNSPFANAGLDQFGQNFVAPTSGGTGNFLAGLIVKKSGLEDYLNKNMGLSYSGGKLSEFKQPTGSVVPNSSAPVLPTGTDAISQPVMPASMQNIYPGAVNSASNTGLDILNAGKSSISTPQ